MYSEQSGLHSGDEFEHFSLKEPHPSIVLSEEELLHLKRDRAAQLQEEERMIAARPAAQKIREKVPGTDGIREALKDVVIANQSPNGVLDAEGRFLRPNTGFAKALHDALLLNLKEKLPGQATNARIFSAVGTLLDLRGVDGILRIVLAPPGNKKKAFDITIDLTTNPEKPGSASNIIALGNVDTLSNPESLSVFTRQIAAAAVELLSLDKKTRAAQGAIVIEAPPVVH